MKTAVSKTLFVFLTVLLLCFCLAMGVLSQAVSEGNGDPAYGLTPGDTWVYDYEGESDAVTFTVQYSGLYTLKCWGAQGGTVVIDQNSANGGLGGFVQATGFFSAGTILYIHVGEAGGTGGSAGEKIGGGGAADPNCVQHSGVYRNATSGGGSTDIRMNSDDLSSRIIVGGGGGGGGVSHDLSLFVDGGAGGGTNVFTGSAGDSAEEGVGGNGGGLTSGTAFHGESTLSDERDDAIVWDCWCTPHTRSKGISTISGGLFGGGGGGYYGGGAGTSRITDPYTDYTPLGEQEEVTYSFAAAGGGGSSFISGFKRNNQTLCRKALGYTFLETDGDTEGETIGGDHEGNGKAEITYVGIVEEYAPNETIERVLIDEDGWYYISANGTPSAEAEGTYVHGYVYLEKDTVVFIGAGRGIDESTGYYDGSTEIRVGTGALLYADAKRLLKAGSAEDPTNNFIAGSPDPVGELNGVAYVVLREETELNTASPVRGGAVLRKVAEAETGYVRQYSGGTEIPIEESGQYRIRVWGGCNPDSNEYPTGKSAYEEGTVWLVAGRDTLSIAMENEINIENKEVEDPENGGTTIEQVETGGITRTQVILHRANRKDSEIITDTILFYTDYRTGDDDESAVNTDEVENIVLNKQSVSTNYALVTIERIAIDTSTPIDLTNTPDRQPTEYDGMRFFYDEVSVTLRASDGGSGVEYIEYTTGSYSNFWTGNVEEEAYDQTNGVTVTITPPVDEELYEDGICTVVLYWRAYDKLDNYEGAYYQFRFDRNINAVYFHTGTGAYAKDADTDEDVEKIEYNVESADIDTTKVVPEGVSGLTYLGWYKLDGSAFLTDQAIETVYPRDKTRRQDLHLYARYTLDAPTVDTGNNSGSVTYNVGSGATVPGFTKSHALEESDLGTLSYAYAWSTKIGDAWSQAISGQSASDLTQAWGAEGISSKGVYTYKELISVKITLAYTSQNSLEYTSAQAESGEYVLTVGKKSLTHADITILGMTITKTYNTTALTQTVTVRDKGATLTLAEYSVGYANNTNAGTATITISATEGGNYADEVSDTFTILPKDMESVQIETPDTVVYTGAQHTPTPMVYWIYSGAQIVLTAGTENDEAGDFLYEYSENTTVFDGGLVTVHGRNNYTGQKSVYFRIEKAQGVIDVSGVEKTYTYTGSLITIQSGATIDNEEQTVTPSCYSNNTFTTVAEGNGKTVTVTVAATDNYLQATASFTITVQKATSYVNVDNVKKTYDYEYDEDGHGVTQTVDAEGLATTTEEQTVLYETETFTDVPEDEDENGYYLDERAYVEESDNYLAAETNFRIYVRKAAYAYTIETDEDGYVARFTYDGVEHVFAVDDLIDVPITQGATVTSADNAVTHVPNAQCEYTVHIAISETRNFEGVVVEAIVRVDPVTAEIVTWDMTLSFTYDDLDHTVDSGAKWILRKEADADNIVTTYSDNTFHNANEYTMIVHLANKDGYYDYVEKDYPVTVTVWRALPVISGDLTDGKLQTQAYYGQTLSQATALPVREDGVYTFDQAGTTALGTVANPITTITATFTPNDTDNYESIPYVPVCVTVLRATRTITWAEADRTYTYDGARHYFSDRGVTVSDPTDGHIAFTYAPAYFDTVADGNGDVTVTVTSDNYETAVQSFAITVYKAKETIDVSRIETIVYDGNPHRIDSGARLTNSEQGVDGGLQYEYQTGNEYFTTVAEAASEDYKVRIYAAETANYEATEIWYQPIMYRATPTIRFVGVSAFTYTGSAQTVGGSASDAELNNDEQTPVFENNVFTTVPEGNALLVRISVAQSANYAAGYLDFHITVEKANPATEPQTVHATYGKPLSFAVGLQAGYSFINPTLAVGTVAQPVTGVLARYTPDDTDNYNTMLNVPLTIIVDKADPELNVSGVRRDYVYTGEEIVVDSGATINNTEQLETLRYSNNTFTNVRDGNNREVYITVDESDNYLSSTRTIIISMRRAEQQVDLDGMPTTYVYTGALQRVEGAVLVKGEGEITYSRNTFVTVEEGNALGSVTVSVPASENYLAYNRAVTFTVEKATQEIDTTVAESGFVYTGERQTVTATVADAEQTLRYENNTFTTVAEGDGMYVRCFVEETANYKATEKRVRISVSKRDPQTTQQNVEAYYGQILYNVESKLDEGYTFEQRLNTSVGTPDSPAEVTVKFTPADTANENVLEGLACTLSVSPRPVTLAIENISTVYGDEGYNEKELTYEITGNTVLEGDDLHVALQREAGSVPGEYAITATFENDLYDVTVEDGVYEIRKRPLKLDFEVKETFYGEDVVQPVYFIAEGSLYGEDTLSGDLDFAVRPTVAFTYEVLCNVTNDKYDISLLTTGYTVKPRPITVYAVVATSVYGTEEDFEYSVEKTEGYELTGEAMLPGDELGGELYLEGKDVGRQSIASALFNANYEITYVPAFCNVLPAQITVTANPATSVYGDAVTFTYDVTEGTLLPGDDLMGTLTQADPEAGEHDISAVFANANYEVTFITATHTITPRPITIKLGNQTKTRSEYMRNSDLDASMFTVTKGTIIGNDDLLLTLTKEEGSDTGNYFMDATSGNPNYEVEVVKGIFSITKDKAFIQVDPDSLTVVYNGYKRMVVATVTSGATPEYYYKGNETEDSLKVPGSYLIRITAPETNNFYAPDAVEVTLTILQAEIRNERSGVSVLSTSGGFKAGEKLIVNSDAGWDEEKNGALPEAYSVTASYVIKKADSKNVESDLEGMVSVTIALPRRYASSDKVEVALVCNGRTSIETVEVGENGEITVRGLNLTQVAVIEKQKTPTLAILLIIAGAALLFLFIGIMINAGIHKR